MAIDPAVQNVLLIGVGYGAAEVSAFIKAKRDRKAHIEDRDYDARLLAAERERAERAEELQACIDVLVECHSIKIRVDGARARAYDAVTRLRLHGDADLALAGSKHYVTASSGTNTAYEVSQVGFINDVRGHFGQEPIQAFVDWMDGEVAVDDL